MKKILLLGLLFAFVFASGDLWAQERTVSGKVTSQEDGSPLPGVTVTLSGTTIGTLTDMDGNYQVSVPESGGTLTFAYVGFTTKQEPIGARTTINVQLQVAITEFDEVVVTGYSVQQKRDITGSISSVRGDVIENLPMQSFDRALQGRAAGVRVVSGSGQPGGAVNVIVRGQGSTRDNTPLYIIDGVQVNTGGVTGQGSSNALAGLNPNDIESIEVLKDAAASAIYGAQSANGVVIITTKRGQKGKSNIDVTYQRGIVQPFELYDIMNAQQFATIREEAYINAGLNPEAAWNQYGNPADPSTFTPVDWRDIMFRNGQISNLNVTASGGDDKTNFYISASHEHQEGQIIMSDWSRSNIRANFEHKATDKLSFKFNTSLSRQNTFGAIANGNFVNGPFQSTFVSQPNSPPINPETGEFNPYPAHLPLTGAGHNFNYNILQGVNEERREATTAQAISSMQINYQFSPELSFRAYGGLDFIDVRSYNERPSTIPAFAGFGGQSFVQDRRILNYNTDYSFSYNKKFSDVHNVSAILGAEYKVLEDEQFNATGRGFANPAFRFLNNAATPFAIGGTYTEFKRIGFFGRVNYDYDGKYYLNATVRRDGHSRFGENVRFGNFWAIGGAWRLSDEGFMDGVGIIDDLKLRFSIGELGNANGIGNFESRALFGAGGQYLGVAGTRPAVLANDLLSWERRFDRSIGVDFSLFGGRIYGAVDVWKANTTDQLFPIPLPTDAGFSSVTGNTAEILNQGIDIEIGGVVARSGYFQWSTSFNVGFLHNEVLSLVDGQDRIGNDLIVGEPLSFAWGVPYVGVNPANGKAMWLDTLGNPSYNAQARDGRVLASYIPTYFGGWSNTFTYKGLSLDIFWQYEGGHSAFVGDMYNLAFSGSTRDNQLVSQLNRWQNPGDITNVPRAFEGGVIDGFDQRFPGLTPSRFLSDASYLRLKQVTLSYELPQTLLSSIGFRRVNLFVTGINLLTITNFDGIDPEVVTFNNNRENNLSTFGTFPNGRQYVAGVTLGF